MKTTTVLFVLLLFALLLLPRNAAAQAPGMPIIASSNYTTATQATPTYSHPGAGVIYALKACSNGSNSCQCYLYDSASGQQVNQRNYAAVSAGNYEPNGDIIPTQFYYGIYVVPSGTGCSCQVWWQ